MDTPESADVRTRIIAEAGRLFVASGYHGLAMREIAAAVGVSKAGLYYHFRDKEDLFLAVLDASLADLERLVSEAATAPTTRERLGALVQAMFARLPEQRAIIRLAGQEVPRISAEARAHFEQRYYQRFIGRIEAMMREGIARGELRPMNPHTATWLLLGMLYPFFRSPHDDEGAFPPETVGLALQVFLDGAAHP